MQVHLLFVVVCQMEQSEFLGRVNWSDDVNGNQCAPLSWFENATKGNLCYLGAEFASCFCLNHIVLD